jgi:hypothetical protein
MNEYPKRIKRRLRELAAVAHERAVRVHLERLAEDFRRWQAGTLDTWTMCDRIHLFHDGPSRDLFVQYTRGPAGMTVAHALATGLLRESEVDAEAREVIAGLVELQREWAQESAEHSGEPD